MFVMKRPIFESELRELRKKKHVDITDLERRAKEYAKVSGWCMLPSSQCLQAADQDLSHLRSARLGMAQFMLEPLWMCSFPVSAYVRACVTVRQWQRGPASDGLYLVCSFTGTR